MDQHKIQESGIFTTGIVSKITSILFSSTTLIPLCNIIKENSNFKTRIHAVQTLQKIRDFSDFGDSNLLVWDAFLWGLQHVTKTTETTQFTDVGYISTLETQLINLFVKLVEMVEDKNSPNEKFSTFLNERCREIEATFANYLRKQFKVTAFSAVYEEEIDVMAILEENKSLSEIIDKLKKAFSTIIKLIDENHSVSIPFSVYDTFACFVHTDLANFGTLEILKIKKTAFDQHKF
jgi:hypothetical protein